MYNSGQKNRFMDAIGLQSGKKFWAESIFNTLEKSEANLKKDIALFSAEEVGTALCSPGITSAITVLNRIPFIVRYKKWCAENGIDAVLVSSSDIKIDFSDSIRSSMVPSPSVLAEILERAFPQGRSTVSLDPVYRAYLWLAFAGMYETDAVQVRERDINLHDLVVSYRGRWYGIRKESAGDFLAAMKVESIGHVMKDGSVRYHRRAAGDCLLRGRKLSREISPENYVRKTLRAIIQTAMEQAGFGSVSYIKVQRSGNFYTMLEREVRGFPPNFYTISCDDYDRGKHNDVSDEMRMRMIYRTNSNYKRDYAAWKKAFEEELKKEFHVETLP